MAESLLVPVIVQLPSGAAVEAERFPALLRQPNWSHYALADAGPGYCVIAQFPGAPEWRALNANVCSVAAIGKRLLAMNGLTGTLAAWQQINATRIIAPLNPRLRPRERRAMAIIGIDEVARPAETGKTRR